MPSNPDDKTIEGRRRFLRLSLGLPLLSAASIFLPADLLAADASAYRHASDVVAPESNVIPKQKPRPPRLLMIDPGHGGRDPGAIGRNFGTHEKDVTLDVARRMGDMLSAVPGIDVRLTREDDTFLPLEERVRLSREMRADLFISVHADSAPNPAARGLSVYTLSEKASDAFSKQLADRENKADLTDGMDLPEADKDVTAILFDLTARRTRNTAQHAKASFVQAMSRNWRLLERPMRAANFVVLRAPDVPSMLVETGFLSNPHDEEVLRQPQERQRIAQLMGQDLATILDSPLFG
jgi:N-acetylmuramoyl-L-alanine amidase